jgi:hydroxymethylpyrimidine pyrophosphatase-like HAD family hydrolase
VKLSAIALDYDGTSTRAGTLDAPMREAIAAVRAAGLAVLFVTGRILDELERVAGGLHLVDAVVAENGAVIHFPPSGYTSSLAPAVPDGFAAALERRGVGARCGRCLVDAAARDAGRMLEVIQALELPLVLIFNAGRVMALPQGVTKGTGLRAALDLLRLSPRNTLAIGDAENDHELLRLAEVGVAVEWGSPALRAAADVVLTGSGPAAVAEYLAGLGSGGRLPRPPRARRRLALGHTRDGREFSLAVRGRNVLVAGDARSGKSWVAGLLCEQLILHGYSVCVLDPEGDYRALERLPGVTALGGDDLPPSPRELLRAVRYPDRSLIIDLSRRAHDEKIQYIRAVLPALNEIRRRTGLPHRILVDEAHYFLHDAGAHQLLDLERNGYTFVTYRASRLPRELVAATDVMIVTCESNPVEVAALRDWCARTGAAGDQDWPRLGRLRLGEAVALPITEEAGGTLQLFTIGPRLTPHVRHREKYVDVPIADHHAFEFGPGACPARTLRQFVVELERPPASRFDAFLRRRDFSRWIDHVFGDHPLAGQIRSIEDQHRQEPAGEAIPQIVGAIRARYSLTAA